MKANFRLGTTLSSWINLEGLPTRRLGGDDEVGIFLRMVVELAKLVSWAKEILKSVPLIFGRADDLNRSEWKLRFAIEVISKLESYFTHTPNTPIPLSSLSPPLPGRRSTSACSYIRPLYWCTIVRSQREFSVHPIRTPRSARLLETIRECSAVRHMYPHNLYFEEQLHTFTSS